MLQFLPYALAAYGGYKGYKASKDAGGSGIQRLLGGVTGATLGYFGGKAGLAGGAKLGLPGFATAQTNFTPFLQSSLVPQTVRENAIQKALLEKEKKDQSKSLFDYFTSRIVTGKLMKIVKKV